LFSFPDNFTRKYDAIEQAGGEIDNGREAVERIWWNMERIWWREYGRENMVERI
jgi:hypothetical protein